MQNTEYWKDINGYDGLYQVSNNGKVRSFKERGGGRLDNPRILKQSILKTHCREYNRVSLSKNKKVKCFYVHRLVAENFILNPKNKPQVNHIDNNPLNNNLNNLEWCTNSENQNHRNDLKGTKNGLGRYIHKNRGTFRVYKRDYVDKCFPTLKQAVKESLNYY